MICHLRAGLEQVTLEGSTNGFGAPSKLWLLQDRQLAQRVAYGVPGNSNPAMITDL
jgi:hypothetical protein